MGAPRKTVAYVVVEPAPRRKGWQWRQTGRTGMTGATSPKAYDTKALAKRAGQRQVDILNAGGRFVFASIHPGAEFDSAWDVAGLKVVDK